MAQSALAAVDAWQDKKWREKQRFWREQHRAWRAQEIQFRGEEILLREEAQDFFQAKLRWREEDMKQRKVVNSRYQWNRFSERNRRDVEEKSEQLRSISWLSGLITSFIFTSPVEFDYPSTNITTARITAYAICVALVPTFLITSTVICMYLLGRILKEGKLFVTVDIEEEFMKQCCHCAESNGSLQALPKRRQTFERFWDIRIRKDWDKAFTLFFWGIFSFLALLCTMGFIKFATSDTVAIIFSLIIGAASFIWIAAQLTWGSYLRKTEEKKVNLLTPSRGHEMYSEGNSLRYMHPLPSLSGASY
eukprot:TRINITY_DN31075_c0_g1_i2.p1 TRINITY_DN31075_c0_g1~~TRINITY_DN31075_c0_g1_i2.p1  ORF type:complete len:306 (-),score=52.14 TRINITY_DN31075_c0_g1_i2:15-932(-)